MENKPFIHISYRSILAVLPQLRGLIALVTGNREWNQSFGQVGEVYVYETRFPSILSHQTKSMCLVKLIFYGVLISVLTRFVQFGLRSFSHIIVVCDTFFINLLKKKDSISTISLKNI